jgi:hypothetical protein
MLHAQKTISRETNLDAVQFISKKSQANTYGNEQKKKKKTCAGLFIQAVSLGGES